MIQNFDEFEACVAKLELLSIMPKEMPGIEKIKRALVDTTWFSLIDAKKIIVVAGTNGKGSTCAILESLLVKAGKTVGFYSSPHLIDTTERIRVNRKQISKNEFVKLYQRNLARIEKFELTHFEALTLMAADYFFSGNRTKPLDYVIFEVGLGGTFDATNAIPHATSVVTALSLDHVNILGHDLLSIAKNKFGIIQSGNLVVHHPLPTELSNLQIETQKNTNSVWYQACVVSLEKMRSKDLGCAATYVLHTKWGSGRLNLLGQRAAENAATALTVFEKLGFDPKLSLTALAEVDWQGRMQQVRWPRMKAATYVSGDHNPHGADSLLQLLGDFSWENIYVIVGIGKDKDAAQILQRLVSLRNCILCLTETPFKGLALAEYSEKFLELSNFSSAYVADCLDAVAAKATANDIVLVTGSLYLVGHVLKKVAAHEQTAQQ